MRLKALTRTGLRVTVSCSEACTIAAQLTQPAAKKRARKTSMFASGSARAKPASVPRSRGARFGAPRGPRLARAVVIGRATGRLAAPGKTTIAIKLTKKAAKALKRARRVTATLTVTARDAAGNAGKVTRKVTAKR